MEPSTRTLLNAIDARGQVAVAFHLPSVRTCASDDQIRGMYFLPQELNLDEIEAVAMCTGGAALLMQDGSIQLPKICPHSTADEPSLIDAHASELELVGNRGTLSIGLGRLNGLPPVVLALDLEEDIARGVAVFRSIPTGQGLDLLASIGVKITSTEPLEDGHVLVHVENRLASHLDAARLSNYERTGNCNVFFLTHGRATDSIEEGLIQANRVRVTAGKERLSEAVVRIGENALKNDLSLEMRSPGASTTRSYGDLVPLGFLGAALDTITTAGGPHAEAARQLNKRVIEKLESARTAGFWGYSTGCIPTSTDTALVTLSGVTPEFDALEELRGHGKGFIPQHVGEDAPGFAMKSSHATAHWSEEDVPTTALLEALRSDAGLPVQTDANWYLARYKRWGGLYFANPALSAWTIARITMRLGPMERLEDVDSSSNEEEDSKRQEEQNARTERRQLYTTVESFLMSLRNDDGSFGRFDPILTNSFAILALAEIGRHDRTVASAQAHVLKSWEHAEEVETPFYSTLRLPNASSTEDVARQLFAPATGACDDGVHQASVYEDPHQLIVASVACLALHVEADPEQPPPLERPLTVHRHPNAPVQQALRHVAAYCEKTAPIGSGLSTPFSYPSRKTSLIKATRSGLKALGTELVSPAAFDRVSTAAKMTNDNHIGASTFGLEIRLHDGDDQIDFLWHAGRSSSNLAALLNNPDPTSSIRHLSSLWKMMDAEKKPVIAFIDDIWFEFDLDQDTNLPPAFFFGPSALTKKRHESYGITQVAENVERVARALQLDDELSQSLAQSNQRLKESGIETAVFQTGLMFSRRSAPIRVCCTPTNKEELDFPWEVFKDQAVAHQAQALSATAETYNFNTAICIDVGPDGISNRVGLEFHSQGRKFDHYKAKEDFHQLCDALVEQGVGAKSRVDAFRSSEGWEELDDNGGCQRTINHVKCLVQPERPTELKGYLALNRTQRPRLSK